MKKIAALVLAFAMVLALCACSGNGNTSIAQNDPLTKEDIIDITILSNASWPYDENWKVWEYIEEGCGATLNINAVPASNYATKYPLMFATSDALVMNKYDMLPYFEFDPERVERNVLDLNGMAKVFRVSTKTGDGAEEFVSWLSARIDAKIKK